MAEEKGPSIGDIIRGAFASFDNALAAWRAAQKDQKLAAKAGPRPDPERLVINGAPLPWATNANSSGENTAAGGQETISWNSARDVFERVVSVQAGIEAADMSITSQSLDEISGQRRFGQSLVKTHSPYGEAFASASVGTRSPEKAAKGKGRK